MLFKYRHKRHDCQHNVINFIQDVTLQSDSMAPHYRKIANSLFKLSNSCRKIFPSRRHLAKKGGVSERTVSRAFLLYERIGFLQRVARPGHSNEFQFNHLLADERVRFALRPFFKAMAVIPIALNLLVSPLQAKNMELVSNSIVSSVLILKEDIYINLTEPKPNSGRIHTHERARDADFGPIFKKENQMNEFKRQGSVIPESIKKCGLHLTAIGEADFARYPDEAIKHALDQLTIASDVSDPFRYACKVANNWCKEKAIQPDHTFSGKHFELLRAELSSPRLIDTDLSDLLGKKPKREGLKAKSYGYTTPSAESDVRKLHPEYEEEKRVFTEKDHDFYDNIEWDESTHRAMQALGIPLETMKKCVSNIKKNIFSE